MSARLRRIALTLLAVASIACQPVGPGGDAALELPRAAASQVPAGAKPTADEAPVESSPGKPLPPIEFDYQIVGTPALGQPLEIRIRARVPDALADLTLALSGDERLQIPIEMVRARIASAVRGEPVTRSVWITPLTPGTHYLEALVEADIDGRVQSRSVTIPIRLGAAAPEAPPAIGTDADGQRIRSLPGEDN